MTIPHPDIGPEQLRALAQSFLDRLDPVLRMAAAALGGEKSPGKCQQVWCPVCALAALASGEEHPLHGVVAEHGTALLAVLRSLVESPASPGKDVSEPSAAEDTAHRNGKVRPSPNRYQHIPITVDE